MLSLPGTVGRRRIYLMRHGHVDYAGSLKAGLQLEEVPLTDRGHDEARAAGLALAHVEFDHAICSGLTRARETAEHVLNLQDRDDAPGLQEDLDFREIRGGGRMRAKIHDPMELSREIAEQFSHADEPGARMTEAGEEFAAAHERAVAALEKALADPSWHTGLIVAHEGINRLILSWATGAGLAASGAFEQDTGCVNVIDLDLDVTDDGHLVRRRIIKAVNLTPYNYMKHGMNLTSLEAIFSGQ